MIAPGLAATTAATTAAVLAAAIDGILAARIKKRAGEEVTRFGRVHNLGAVGAGTCSKSPQWKNERSRNSDLHHDMTVPPSRPEGSGNMRGAPAANGQGVLPWFAVAKEGSTVSPWAVSGLPLAGNQAGAGELGRDSDPVCWEFSV